MWTIKTSLGDRLQERSLLNINRRKELHAKLPDIIDDSDLAIHKIGVFGHFHFYYLFQVN